MELEDRIDVDAVTFTWDWDVRFLLLNDVLQGGSASEEWLAIPAGALQMIPPGTVTFSVTIRSSQEPQHETVLETRVEVASALVNDFLGSSLEVRCHLARHPQHRTCTAAEM